MEKTKFRTKVYYELTLQKMALPSLIEIECVATSEKLLEGKNS